jgi:hypothetical protein
MSFTLRPFRSGGPRMKRGCSKGLALGLVVWFITLAVGVGAQEIPPECRERLDAERPRRGTAPISRLGDCVYDFLAFIDGAERLKTRTEDGLSKTGETFFEHYLRSFEEWTRERLRDAEPEWTPFARRRVERLLAEAVRTERIRVSRFIGIQLDRQRYYVNSARITFVLDGGYDFDKGVYSIQATLATDETADVFFGRCELKVLALTHRFELAVDEATAERIASKPDDKRIDLDGPIYVYPHVQGVYAPSWLFKDLRYEAYARFWMGDDFRYELERRMARFLLSP